ncbi:MAG TPA: MBOAT family O-acyltransferase [Candidatus Binatia bacterium]|nr:MBOAT family O-acyltransferase [Candidatus Binatia bacterium]
MIPYADFGYFLLLLYPLLALVVLGLLGWLRRPSVLALSLGIAAFQYANPLGDAQAVAAGMRQLVFFAAYVVASVTLVRGYAALRGRCPEQPLFYAAVTLALVPLVWARLYPAAVAHGLVGRAVGPGKAPLAPGVPSGLFDAFGFLGISYMTLRVVDAIIVLHDGVVKGTPRVADLASYLAFAPTISAGPIDRFHRFTRALDALPRRRADYLRDLEAGVHRIAQGFLYKFIVAYSIYRHALVPLAGRPGLLAGTAYMYAFSLYLFFDFAGYSAFAVGVGRFFGMPVPENFRAPFASRNFREMWDRWHISLSWWLRDHVYMRFMLSAARRRWFGGDRRRAHAVGLLLTMALMGCWHGLEPQYLVYGLYQGVMLVGYDVVGRWNRQYGWIAEGAFTDVAGTILTANLFCFGLLIFSGRLFGGH